jgi:hypothetical protein
MSDSPAGIADLLIDVIPLRRRTPDQLRALLVRLDDRLQTLPAEERRSHQVGQELRQAIQARLVGEHPDETRTTRRWNTAPLR